MNLGGNARVVLISVVLLLIGGTGAVMWTQQSQIRSLEGAMRILKGRMAQVQEERESLRAQLTQLETDRSALADQLAAAKRQADEAQHTMASLQQQQSEWSARYTALESEKQSLMTQLASATKERDQYQQQIALLQGAQRDLEHRYQELQQRYTAASQPLPSGEAPAARAAPDGAVTRESGARESGAIELPPIVVHHGAPPAAMPEPPAAPAAARVVEVNERYQFLVIDQGASDGVQTGAAVEIVRNGVTVARGTVRQTRERLAACDLASAGDVAAVRIGDAAVWRRN